MSGIPATDSKNTEKLIDVEKHKASKTQVNLGSLYELAKRYIPAKAIERTKMSITT